MYYLLNTSKSKLTGFRKVPLTSREDYFAKVILRIALAEDNLNMTKVSRVEFLKGWAEHMNENSEETHEAENIADTVADHLVYGNSLHILNEKKFEVNNEFRKKVYLKIVDILEDSFEKQTA